MSQTLHVNGTSVSVSRSGTGTPLLVLHGPDGPAEWSPHMDELQNQFEVIVPLHPGFLDTTVPEWLTSVSDLAYFYLDVLDALGLDEVDLVGLSLGGWVAADLVAKNDSRIRSLTLVAPAGVYAPGLAGIDTFVLSDQDRITAMVHDPGVAEKVVAQLVQPTLEDALLNNRKTTALLTWSPRDYDPRLRHWLHRITVPTTIVWGACDTVAPPELGQVWTQLIPGSELVVVPECGHLPSVEKPHELAEIVIRTGKQTGSVR